MTIQSPPPRLAKWLLGLMIDEEDKDAILGDFAEEYYYLVLNDSRKAKWFYWQQVIQSFLPLVGLKFSRQVERSLDMFQQMPEKNKRLFWISLIFLLPATVLVLTGILQSGFGITSPNDSVDSLFKQYPVFSLMYHPLLLLSGVGLTVFLNFFSVSKLNWDSKTQSLSATFIWKNNLIHWMLLGIGIFLLATILAYGIVENFNIIQR